MSHCLKRGNQNLSFESLRGIVRPNKLSEVKSLPKANSLFMSKSGQFLKDFSYAKTLSSCFLHWPITTEAKRSSRIAGYFTVAIRWRWCGWRNSKIALIRLLSLRRVLPNVHWLWRICFSLCFASVSFRTKGLVICVVVCFWFISRLRVNFLSRLSVCKYNEII